MIPGYPQRPGFHLPFIARHEAAPALTPALAPAVTGEVPDHHTQLEELLGHIRRCERWARLDDLIDLNWRLEGGGTK